MRKPTYFTSNDGNSGLFSQGQEPFAGNASMSLSTSDSNEGTHAAQDTSTSRHSNQDFPKLMAMFTGCYAAIVAHDRYETWDASRKELLGQAYKNAEAVLNESDCRQRTEVARLHDANVELTGRNNELEARLNKSQDSRRRELESFRRQVTGEQQESDRFKELANRQERDIAYLQEAVKTRDLTIHTMEEASREDHHAMRS